MRGEWPKSLLALAFALIINHKANAVAEALGAEAPVAPDTILALLPRVNPAPLVWLYLAGMGGWIVYAFWHALTRERPRAPLIARRFALLLLLKSGLMLLTPLRIPDGSLSLEGSLMYSWVGRWFTVSNDLFFSTHTAAPFLAFLLFQDRRAKAICLGWSVVMAATVLLGRMHYSVDVAGAFLIAYAVAALTPPCAS